MVKFRLSKNGTYYNLFTGDVLYSFGTNTCEGYQPVPSKHKTLSHMFKKRVMVSTAAFLATVRGPVPGLGGLKETKMFLPHPRVEVSIVGSLRDRGVAFSTSAARARISNAVSRGQCHLNHLTILRRFSWPSLAYMCTKVA